MEHDHGFAHPVIFDARQQFPCIVHKEHRPRPARTVQHHVWPQEFGGPTIPANLIWICDTGHYTIHAGLTRLLAGLEPLIGTPMEISYMRLGLARIKRSAL